MRNEKGQFVKGGSGFTGRHTDESKLKMREATLRNPPRYWLGKKLTEEHKRNMVRVRIENKSYIAWNKGLRLPQYSGENAPNWKGGRSKLHELIRGSKEIKDWRKKVFERDDYTCKFCGKRGGLLNADHIKAFSKFPELRFDVENGRTLCAPCHKQTDTYAHKTK